MKELQYETLHNQGFGNRPIWQKNKPEKKIDCALLKKIPAEWLASSRRPNDVL